MNIMNSAAQGSMLIARAEIAGARVADLRIENGRITAIGQLAPRPREPVLDLAGGAALPGLHDHHIHLLAYAAALDSVACGPPDVRTPEQLIEALGRAQPGQDGWVRGVGYHESVAGDLDRHWLDAHLLDVPVRIQHRSGRLWMVNGAALQLLEGAADSPLPLHEAGRFYDKDETLGRLWGVSTPPVEKASRRLAAYGVTGLTDLTPRNDSAAVATIARLQSNGALLQRIRVGGVLEMGDGLPGPVKVHLHESSLPEFGSVCDLVRAGHERQRAVAVHCVTEAELVFALAAFREAGTRIGDRIEHASVTPPILLEQIRELGLIVVTQPHFVAERGDAYRSAFAPREQAWLYRCRAFLDMGIPLAGGSDAPYGHADPWRAMRAAVTRQTASGAAFGADERLSPEEALALFLGSLAVPHVPRSIEVGAQADLCLLDRPWRRARVRLDSACVLATVRAGELIHGRFESFSGCGPALRVSAR